MRADWKLEGFGIESVSPRSVNIGGNFGGNGVRFNGEGNFGMRGSSAGKGEFVFGGDCWCCGTGEIDGFIIR